MEGLGFCIFSCFFGIIGVFLAVFGGSLMAATAGIISSVAFGKHRKFTRPALTVFLVGLIVLIAVSGGCWLAQRSATRPNHHITDIELKPFRLAIDEVDRTALGFTPISPNARIEIEYAREASPYDVMLHLYAETSRTIAFKKEDDIYKWIGEQEIHYGPHQYRTVDGLSTEHIVITYNVVPISGGPINEVFIRYEGEDIRLNSKGHNLTLQEVEPFLAEWRSIQPTPTPW